MADRDRYRDRRPRSRSRDRSDRHRDWSRGNDHRDDSRRGGEKERDDRDYRRRSRSRSRDRHRNDYRRDDRDRDIKKDDRGRERDREKDFSLRESDRPRGPPPSSSGRDLPAPAPSVRADRNASHATSAAAPGDMPPPPAPSSAPGEPPKPPPIQPNFGLSGALAKATLEVNGVTLKFSEPPEARKPSQRWVLFVFKNGELTGEPLHVHRASCYLFGRDRKVADIPTDHLSCSSQHAVLQYRLVDKIDEDGMDYQVVQPYLMDLESTNGTFINNERIEAHRYYQLLDKDMIKMGNSSREYVLMLSKD